MLNVNIVRITNQYTGIPVYRLKLIFIVWSGFQNYIDAENWKRFQFCFLHYDRIAAARPITNMQLLPINSYIWIMGV